MEKAFKNFFQWKNQPNADTPLGARLLNMINNIINLIDDRVVAMDTSKLSVDVANGLVKDISLNKKTGVITITKLNGSIVTIDTKLEKIAVNIGWDAKSQKLILYLDDGTEMELDLSTLITQYEFVDTDTIAFILDGTGKVSSVVKNGSITEEKLRPNFLADIKVQAAQATAQANRAAEQALISQSYAVGNSGIRNSENEDNSKYYAEQAKNYMNIAQSAVGVSVPQFYIDFSAGCLMSETEAAGIEFGIEDGNFVGRIVKE